MNLILDVCLLAALGIPAFVGWKRGFAESVLRFGRLILALAATLIGGKAFSALLNRLWIYPAVYARVNPKFTDIAAAAEGRVEVMIQKIPAFFRPYLDVTGADASNDLYQLAGAWSDTVSRGIAGVISSIVGYVLLFILSFLLLTLAIFVLRRVTKLPVIRTADQLLGLALGAVGGLMLTVFLAGVLGDLMEILGRGDVAARSILLRLLG